MAKPPPYSTAPIQETAILVGVQTPSLSDAKLTEYLDELEFLALTAGAIALKRFTQKLPNVHPRTFTGPGKIEEISQYAEAHGIHIIIFDDELTPSQIRNLETIFPERKILDRTNLILDIFARHARTAQAKTQVELAQTQYLLPRLTRMWTHLSKQKGGIGMRGPGEKEIETDRRMIRYRISLLKEELQKIDRVNATQRQKRQTEFRIALVGYTNVGKSTIMNALAKSEVLAENKLFATLDATVRKVVLDNEPFLLSDTVGFIRKLPHQLVECFKSTLDEVREADLLVHVVDVSHVNFEEHMDVVKQTLVELGAGAKPQLIVFNKVDALKTDPEISREEFLANMQKTWMARTNSPMVMVSAAEKWNLDKLRAMLIQLTRSQVVRK